jgi:hypothetical protein
MKVARGSSRRRFLPRSARRGLPLALLAALAAAAPAAAQPADRAVRLAVGFGVDTTGVPYHEIFELWRAYLSSRPSCMRPSPLWSESERMGFPSRDLLCGFVYQGFRDFTVVALAPAVGLDSTYLIRTLVASIADSGRSVLPLALYRVYAVREGGRWVLANALPRLTRRWRHETVGRIRFVFPPTHRFSRRRAEVSARFVDSLARAFEVPPPDSITYVFTDDFRETLLADGLDFFPLGSDTAGGRAGGPNLVLIGSSKLGEAYLHELGHVVLRPFFDAHRAAGLVQEGMVTWAGGSAGLDFRALMPGLARYLDAHPDVTLEHVMADPPRREGTLDVGYDGLAALCRMVFDAGGLAGLRALADAGRDPAAVVGAAARVLRVEPGDLDRLWRARVASLAR